MNRKLWRVFAGLCVVAISAVWALPTGAQMAEAKCSHFPICEVFSGVKSPAQAKSFDGAPCRAILGWATLWHRWDANCAGTLLSSKS